MDVYEAWLVLREDGSLRRLPYKWPDKDSAEAFLQAFLEGNDKFVGFALYKDKEDVYITNDE